MQCQECGRTASSWTAFGISIGPHCDACCRAKNQQLVAQLEPMLRNKCATCGDYLTGHEDDSATRCRWCVTCVPAVDGDSVLSNERFA